MTGRQPLNHLFLLIINVYSSLGPRWHFDKANVLKDFFCKQTMLNNENVSFPELPLFDGVGLSNIIVTCDESK